MSKTKNRYVVLFASMAIQLCTGIIYMWSVFQQFLTQNNYYKTNETAMVSSVMLAFFVVGILFGGRFSDKIGPKKIVIVGSCLFAIGLFLTSFVLTLPVIFLYLTYAVIGGVGVGAAYNTSIACAQRWFPDKRGFATGMIVGAFGFSVVLFTPLSRWLLGLIDAKWTFLLFAGAFLVICLVASLFIENPPLGYMQKGDASKAQEGMTSKEMLKTPQFYLLTFSMMMITPAFFILNPLFMTLGIERGLSQDLATIGVMITGIASASGRLIMPWISDKISRKGAIIVISLITLVSMILMIFSSGIVYLVLISLIAFAYGGSSGVFPPFASDLYGSKHAGENYGFVMVGFGLSAIIFPLLSTVLSTQGGGNYTLSFIIAAATNILAMVALFLIKPIKKKDK